MPNIPPFVTMKIYLPKIFNNKKFLSRIANPDILSNKRLLCPLQVLPTLLLFITKIFLLKIYYYFDSI